MKVSLIPTVLLALTSLSLPACHRLEGHEEQAQQEHHKIVATSPQVKDVILTQQYVCQIHSQNPAKVSPQGNGGYIEEVLVKEGQPVKKGEVMFRIRSALYQARLDAELAETQLAQIEFNNTKSLFEKNVVSQQEVALAQAKLAKAQAKAKEAATELSFTTITAPFDGLIDHLHEQNGSMVKEGDVLTTLCDNSVMRVYYNVSEIRYLEYMASRGQDKESHHIELVLADGSKFPHAGVIVGPLAECDPRTGTFRFRADFPNPDRLLRHGQTGNVLLFKTLKNAIVIPQRATFEVLDKRYVYAIGNDNVVHQHEIAVEKELEDVFVIKSGLNASDRIVLEGVRQVRDDEKVEFEYRDPQQVLANLKNKAE